MNAVHIVMAAAIFSVVCSTAVFAGPVVSSGDTLLGSGALTSDVSMVPPPSCTCTGCGNPEQWCLIEVPSGKVLQTYNNINLCTAAMRKPPCIKAPVTDEVLE